MTGKSYHSIDKFGTHSSFRGIGIYVFVNDKPVCTSTPEYAKVESRGKDEAVHYTIKEMSLCETQYQLKKGDRLRLKAEYDIEKYPQ
jgi:hypothetical protein